MGGLEGLADKSVDLQGTHGHDAGAIRAAGDDDQRRAAAVATYLFEQASAGAIWQIPVADEHVGRTLLPFAQCRADAFQAYHLTAGPQAEDDLFEQIGNPAVVFQNHDAHAWCLISWSRGLAPIVWPAVLLVAGGQNSSLGHDRSRVAAAARPARAVQCLQPAP